MDKVVHTCKLSILRMEAGEPEQGRPQLHIKFKANLGDKKPCLKSLN